MSAAAYTMTAVVDVAHVYKSTERLSNQQFAFICSASQTNQRQKFAINEMISKLLYKPKAS